MADTNYSFTLQVTDALGKTATLVDSILVRDAVVTPDTVTLQDRTIRARADTTRGVRRTTATTLTLAANGRLSTSEGFTSSTEWGVSITGADWQVRVTPVGGATFSGSAVGSWLTLDADRSWTEEFTADCANGLPAAQVTSMVVEIRDAATETISATCTITHDHLINPTAATVRLTNANYVGRARSFSGDPAYAVVALEYGSDGQLRVYCTTLENEPAQEILVPSEWGVNLSSSDYEIKFDIVSTTPGNGIVFYASPNFGTWGSAALGCGMNITLPNLDSLGSSANATVRATIRPVGGSPVATADYGITLSTLRSLVSPPPGYIP